VNRPIKIGTRGSKLALWQANRVKDLLLEKGIPSELHIIHSTGDKDRKAKLHEMGLIGVFTKELDDALLIQEIDIAVHSLKDVPTSPPKGITQCAVLERANPHDALITASDISLEQSFKLATGSLRRRAFWKNKYPNHELIDLRGNVPTRLQKLENEDIDGIILAKAGLDRLEIFPEHFSVLDWMIPAPAQGIVGVFCLEQEVEVYEALQRINHSETEKCAYVERDFLKTLEGGCTAPIGGLAMISGDSISLNGCLLSEDGSKKINLELTKALETYKTVGSALAKEILKSGGKQIMNDINKAESHPRVLCLKKLTPPRIKLGTQFGLALESKEVIETVTDFDSIKVKSLINGSNNYIFSSLNSVNAISTILKKTAIIHKNIYCVGSRVANYFHGKVKSIHQVNEAADLVELARNSGETSFSWFHGNLSNLELVDQFLEHEIELLETSVYRTEPLEPIISNLENYDAMLFFSPSGVRSFLKNNQIPDHVKVGAIGNITAEALEGRADFTPSNFEFKALLAATENELING